MRVSFIVASLVLGSVVVVGDSIYDGTGSLINANQTCWGCDRDEAMMHPHKNKNSTVTFQILRNKLNCDHINIHSDINLEQDIQINLKAWSDTSVQQSYKVRLPYGKWSSNEGISLDMKTYSWTTLAITTTKPLSTKASIYAYCRNSIDPLNDSDLEVVSINMTKLDKNHFHLGNGSLITKSENNGQDNFGVKRDTAMSSTTHNAETSFQILGDRDSCPEIKLSGSSSKIEEVLVKGWSEDKWKPASCTKLPCTVKAYLRADNKAEYTLINIKTKANSSNKYLHASCLKEKVKFNLKEKLSTPKHPNDCKFTDVSKSRDDYKYITALCSAGIVEGYGSTSYTKFGPDNVTLWSELAKVVNLSKNFYKTKKIRNSYSYGDWYDAYLDIAKKQGFDYSPDLQFNRGLGYQYIVKVFWDKTLTQEEASNFLRNKEISYRSNISPTMKRGYMAEVVLKSAKISADESGIERKMPYVNHDTKDLDIKKEESMPTPTFETPKSDDSMEKKLETVKKNIEKSLKENNTVSEKNKTNNTGATINNLGGKKALKPNYQDKKTAEEFIEEAKSQGVSTPVNETSKIEDESIVKINNQSTGEQLIAPTLSTRDSNGNHKIMLETESGKNKEVTKEELEKNNFEVELQVKVEKVLEPK
jgi:hypothetical protein